MLSQFCSNLLLGQPWTSMTRDEQIITRLDLGVSVRKDHSIKGALVMLEVLRKELPDLSPSEKLEHWERFVTYLFDNLAEPAAMAVVKYAIANRKIVIRGMAASPAMAKLNPCFSALYLQGKKERESSCNKRFSRIYDKLKAHMTFSDSVALAV